MARAQGMSLLSNSPLRRSLVPLVLVSVGLLWSYWPALSIMAHRWATDARYSHGYLVPMFALVLLWLRRERLDAQSWGPSWWGVPLIAIGAGLRLFGTFIYFDWLEAISLLPSLAGLLVLVGGWGALRWSWPAIAFLAFMAPLPFRLELALGWPLQRLATEASTYILQTLGLPALAQGNIILMEHAEIGVVEACSGLSMMILFFALATGVAMLVPRPLIDRLLIVASAVPIALIANVTRITVTGVLHETVGSEIANVVFHDLAGWLMMPLALGLLWLEIVVLSHLIIEVEAETRPTIPLAGMAVTDLAPSKRVAKKSPLKEAQGPVVPRP